MNIIRTYTYLTYPLQKYEIYEVFLYSPEKRESSYIIMN